MPRRGLAADVAGFKADAIYRSHVDAIRNRVSALNRTPRIVLRQAKLGFFRRMPADRRGIKKHLRPLQRGQAGSLGEPLIPADQRAQAAYAGIERAKPEIAGSEIKLFVIERIVGDMHLAVEAARSAVAVENGCGVVIDAGCSL